jgi:hypothetical protein
MMRRRFGRGRKKSSDKPKGAPIDAARCFERIVNEKVVEADALTPLAIDEIADDFAVVATGETGSGGKLVVAFAPLHGGDAALAGLAYAQSLVGDAAFNGEVVAVCPQWSIAARRRLGLLAAPGLNLRAVAASTLADGKNTIEIPTAEIASGGSVAQLAKRFQGPSRDLFLRSVAALEGLAVKHRGAVRVVGTSVELVLLARRTALIRVEEEANGDSRVVLETLLPEKTSEPLDEDGLAVALDRLEGSLRKRLNDRRMKTSEEMLRTGTARLIADAEGVRNVVLWPLAGSDLEVLDFIGVAADGVPVIAVSRSNLSILELAAILDAVAALQPSIPRLLAGAGAPLRLDSVRLVLAAKEFGASVPSLLSLLSIEHRIYDLTSRFGRAPTLSLRGAGAPVPMVSTPRESATEEERPEEGSPARSRGSRRRRGRRGGSQRTPRERSESSEAEESTDSSPAKKADAPSESRYDEVSVFDLDEVSDSGGDSAPRRSRRGRKRSRRGGRSGSSGDGSDASRNDSKSEDEEPARAKPEAAESSRSSRGRGRGRKRETSRQSEPSEEPDDEVDDELADALIPQVAEIDEPEVDADLLYDEDGESPGAEEADPTAVESSAEVSMDEAVLQRPRRRAAIVAHADRGSLIAAVLLARDLRLVEGIWVYPQSDLMTFFRSVATDLREETPIYLIGFTASPARDVIQAAALYSDRIAWFDHHDWPPEDLENLRGAIGESNTYIRPGVESSIPAVLSERTRRSRFSDKVVELATGRFTQHDYERWGRVWWDRLANAAAKPGERRADLEPLLVGRASDLAVEAAEAEKPPAPREVEFVANRDFRVVHFGGFRMVVVPTPLEFDVHLAGRVARERYDAQLSLTFSEGEEAFILAGEEGPLRRNLDLISMATHLVAKHEWIEALPVDDFVARFRVRDLTGNPERLDEVIGEIAMGRSILEG